MNRLATSFYRIINTPRLLAITILVDWVVCSALYSLIENKGPIEGLWWGIVTGSTVGYGDFYPDSTAGRGVGAILIVSLWGLVLIAGAHMAARLVENNTPSAFTHEEQCERAEVDDETNRLVHENNAMLRKLLTMQRIDPSIVIADSLPATATSERIPHGTA